MCLQSSFQLIVHVTHICRQLHRSAGFKREKILSAIKGIPAEYSLVVCSAPKFMDKVSAYCWKCVENVHVSKKQIEFIVFPIQRWPLATFSPNTLTQIQTKDACSTTLSFLVYQSSHHVWHESGCSGKVNPSKRHQDTLRTSVAPRGCADCKLHGQAGGCSAVDTSAAFLCCGNAAEDCHCENDSIQVHRHIFTEN